MTNKANKILAAIINSASFAIYNSCQPTELQLKKFQYRDAPASWFTCGINGCEEEPVFFDKHFPYFTSNNRCPRHIETRQSTNQKG
ncbi:hypothetical protein [Photobacterium damselae]|uniref:hypothetical protein n=1 Tax=Photobacterium damselae TaxID=38293 RepID=UPI0040679647